MIVGCMAVATTTAMLQGMLLADDVAEPIENPIGWLGYDDVDHTSQAAVDRRFNRARYDAALVVEQFASRLRHDVDLGALVRDLGDTVATTMQPAHVSLWVPDRQSIR